MTWPVCRRQYSAAVWLWVAVEGVHWLNAEGIRRDAGHMPPWFCDLVDLCCHCALSTLASVLFVRGLPTGTVLLRRLVFEAVAECAAAAGRGYYHSNA